MIPISLRSERDLFDRPIRHSKDVEARENSNVVVVEDHSANRDTGIKIEQTLNFE